MPRIWKNHLPPGSDFLLAWRGVIEDARCAHFAFRSDYLAWEGAHGRRFRAAVTEAGARRGALLLAPKGQGWTCGRPWRVGAVLAGTRQNDGPMDLSMEDAVWLFRGASEIAGGARLHMYLPFEPPPGVPGYMAGASIHQDVQVSDADLLAAMSSSKRRMVRRASERGYQVRDADGIEDLRAFHRLAVEAQRQRGEEVPEENGVPEPGTGWREWELPWMWLLVVGREGRVESGAVDSIGPGWSVEARTAALSADARRDGAFALLCLEEARRARDMGLRWINHGGDTVFKREITGKLGRRVPMWCWLAGGPQWAVANLTEAAVAHMRIRLAAVRNRGYKAP